MGTTAEVLIAEIYASIQGEGRHSGTPSVFVRTSGCNLRCWFCDTAYTSWNPEGVRADWRDVAEQALVFDCEHVVVTGGEPLLAPEVVPLTERLRAAGRYVTIETAGTIDRPVAADLMSISPKLSNSTPDDPRWGPRHDRVRQQQDDVIRRLMARYDFQLKFVVDSPEDVDEVSEYLSRLADVPADAVWLMPQGTDVAQLSQTGLWLEPVARQHGFRFCPRRHIEEFGHVRGT